VEFLLLTGFVLQMMWTPVPLISCGWMSKTMA